PQQTPKSAFTSPPPSQGIPSGTATFTPDPPAEKPKPIPAPEPALPPSPIVKAEPATGACDYRLQEVWERQIIKIEGIDHYLARAFTLDLDNNGRVDNVSFTFFDKDGKKTVLHYFGFSGERSGRDYPALALPNDSLIGRLCFGESRYEKPQFFSNEPVKRALIEIEGPDLAGQKAAKDRGIEYVPRTKKKDIEKKEEPISWLLWGSIGGLALIAAGGGVFLLRRKKAAAAAAAKTKAEAEEEDEEGGKKRPKDRGDDDEKEDGDKKPTKTKFNLGGLFSRGKKKKAADGKDDDADDGADREDDKDGPKKKGSKFSLGGLFKRKKKKASDDDSADKDDANRGEDKNGDDKDGPKKKKSKFSLGGLFKRAKKKKKKKGKGADDGDDTGE
ncbi:MAG: hypothetical protein O3A85_08365, partial [Proteobacteria bacterium]|nr:hypothetical protein [Pseudomonadota bacterium]